MSGGEVAGFIAAWIFAGAIVALVAGRFFTVADAQHHRRMSQEQRLSGGDPERAGRLSVGGQVGDQHSPLVASQE